MCRGGPGEDHAPSLSAPAASQARPLVATASLIAVDHRTQRSEASLRVERV